MNQCPGNKHWWQYCRKETARTSVIIRNTNCSAGRDNVRLTFLCVLVFTAESNNGVGEWLGWSGLVAVVLENAIMRTTTRDSVRIMPTSWQTRRSNSSRSNKSRMSERDQVNLTADWWQQHVICCAELLPAASPAAAADHVRHPLLYVLLFISNKLCGRPPQYAPAPASWPLTFWRWKWCPSHVWRGLPLCQF